MVFKQHKAEDAVQVRKHELDQLKKAVDNLDAGTLSKIKGTLEKYGFGGEISSSMYAFVETTPSWIAKFRVARGCGAKTYWKFRKCMLEAGMLSDGRLLSSSISNDAAIHLLARIGIGNTTEALADFVRTNLNWIEIINGTKDEILGHVPDPHMAKFRTWRRNPLSYEKARYTKEKGVCEEAVRVLLEFIRDLDVYGSRESSLWQPFCPTPHIRTDKDQLTPISSV